MPRCGAIIWEAPGAGTPGIGVAAYGIPASWAFAICAAMPSVPATPLFSMVEPPVGSDMVTMVPEWMLSSIVSVPPWSSMYCWA